METVTNNLSKEQLLDYVKKQKLKLKKLEKDIETLKKENDSLVQAQKQNVASTSNDGSSASGGSSKEAIDPMLFWPMIMRQSPYVQSLAKCALNSFVSACTNTIMASNDANKNKVCIGGPHRSLRNGFRKWKIAAMEMRADAAKQAVESLESKYAQSEQKIAKLKVLLSKVNQANQRNMENTNAYKKAGEDVQMELYALKQKENSEKQSLMEALRVQSMESAFQYDTELTIQRAAEAMIYQQQQAHSSAANQTKKVKDFEDEKSQLVEQIKSLEQKREDMLRLQQSVQDKLDAATRKIAQLESQLRDSKAVSEQLLFKLKEEEEQREEVELELKATLNSRTTLLHVV
jgi:predicted  nucleic acid-binding Zn-ribbon protein